MLIAGDELGPLGGLPGSDSNLLVDASHGATAVSVGVEPSGVPAGVVDLGGGPDMFAAVLEDQIARRQRGELPIVELDPAWMLVIDGVDPLLERFHESLFTLADGLLGTRGSVIAETSERRPRGADVRRVHENRRGGAPAGRAALEHDRSRRSLAACRSGAYSISTPACSSNSCDRRPDRSTRCCSPRSRDQRPLRSESGTAAQASTRPGHSLAPPGPTLEEGQRDGAVWMRVRGRPGSIVAAAHDQLTGTVGDRVLDRVAAYEGAARGPADEGAALDRLQCARRLGFDGLLAEHRRAWASRWEDADVLIDGDPELQLAVRFAIFHLLASAPDHGEAAVGARGLSGSAYRGHVFWDTDVYVLPFLAATHPQAARAMLEYRVRRLPAAIRAATRPATRRRPVPVGVRTDRSGRHAGSRA